MFWFQGPSCCVSVIANRSFWRHEQFCVSGYHGCHVPRRLKGVGAHITTCWDVGSSTTSAHALRGSKQRAGGGGHLTWSWQSMHALMYVGGETPEGCSRNVSWQWPQWKQQQSRLLTSKHPLHVLYSAWCHLSDCGMPVRVWPELKVLRSHGLSLFPSKMSSKCSRNGRGERERERCSGPDFCFQGICSYIGLFEQIIHWIFDLRIVFLLKTCCDTKRLEQLERLNWINQAFKKLCFSSDSTLFWFSCGSKEAKLTASSVWFDVSLCFGCQSIISVLIRLAMKQADR